MWNSISKCGGSIAKNQINRAEIATNLYLLSVVMAIDEFAFLNRCVRILEARIPSLHSKKE